MRNVRAIAIAVAAVVLTSGACGPDPSPSAPGGRDAERGPGRPSLSLIYGTVCAEAHDEVVQFQLTQDGCAAAEAGGFDRDEPATFRYQYAPANNVAGEQIVLATFEYRYLPPVNGVPRYGMRRLDVVNVPQFGVPVSTNALNVQYIRELAQLKIVGYLSACTPAQSSPADCWDAHTSDVRHMEPRICVDNPGTSPPVTADDDCATGPDGGSEGHNLLPTASFRPEEQQRGITGGQCAVWRFDAGNSTDPDGVSPAAFWEFGDGQADNSGTQVVLHSYCAPGPYTVRLRVEDAGGGTDVARQVVTPSFDDPPPPPLQICGDTVVAPQTTYTWTACQVTSSWGASYAWYRANTPNVFEAVGKGTSYTGSSGTSNFTLKLVRRDYLERRDSTMRSIRVLAPPPPPPAPPTVSISGPSTVRANITCRWEAVASGGAPPYRYQWYRGVAPVSTTYEYIGPTGTVTFTLRVDVVDNLGARGSASLQVSPVAVGARCLL